MKMKMKFNSPGLGLGLVNLVGEHLIRPNFIYLVTGFRPNCLSPLLHHHYSLPQIQNPASSSSSSASRLGLVYFSFSRSRRSWLLMEKISVGVRFRPLASSCDSDSGRKWQISDKVISLCHFNTPVSGLTFSFGIFLSPPSNHKLSLNFLSLLGFTFTDSLRFLFVCLPDKYVYMFLLMQIMCLIRVQVM